MLEVSSLSVSYGAHRALEDVSIRTGKGEICVILGANGAGKSTLLKTVAGMVAAQSGKVAVGGSDITRAAPNRIVEAGLALVPEGRGIFGDLTVAENLRLGAYGRQARSGANERLERVLTLFPRLAERRGQVARTMSGGEQQMVAIGRALMSNPSILMLDEPSLGLSPLLTRELFRSLGAVRDTGVGILMVEQNARQSLAIADRGYLVENGHITGEGRASDLASDPAVQAAYLGSAAASTERGRGTVSGRRDVSGDATVLAARAARIQRDHVHALRVGRGAGGHVNGHSVVLGATSSKGDPILMDKQAHELSGKAADFAARAADIQRRHIEAAREADVGTSLPGAAPAPPEQLAARAAAIHRAHVDAGRNRAGFDGHADPEAGMAPDRQISKEQKKLLKKARKAAKRAQKLADKALRAIG